MENKRPFGMLASNARQYHFIYQYDIAYKLLTHKHLSVTMPPVIGLDPLISNVNDIFHGRKRITVVMENQERVDQLNSTISAFGMTAPVFPTTVDWFLDHEIETDAYILYNLDQVSRILIGEFLVPKKNRIVISAGKPPINEAGEYIGDEGPVQLGTFSSFTLRDSIPHPMVFPVDSILDIRDIMYAAPEEKSRLLSMLQNTVMLYQMDIDKAERKKREEELEQEKRQNEEQLRELERLKKELEATKRMNEAMLFISRSAGIDREALENAASKLILVKEKYGYMGNDEEQEELEIAELQDEAAQVLAELSDLRLNTYSRDAFEKKLILLLGEETWSKLNAKSKEYLISARMNYEAMIQSEDKDKFDYSGVCLQVTKVLDEEMTRRVYYMYVDWLKKKYPPATMLDRWPNGLIVRDKYTGDDVIRDAQDFTLGTIAHVIGADAARKIRDRYGLNEFVEYARTTLYKPGYSVAEITDKVVDIAVTAEKVRNDFRNPSAHRETLSRKTAEDCMAYMLDQIKKLKLVLQDMRV